MTVPVRMWRGLRAAARVALAGGLLLALAAGAAAQGQDHARGAEIFRLCAACHGDGGGGDATRGAPVIAGLAPWYLDAQLRKFRDGQRGYRPDDDAGLQMRPMASALRGDADVEAVVAYVNALAPPPPVATLTGDSAHGQTLYATCIACHGPEGKGNEALKAPALTGQADWYVVAQLRKFRDGRRGAHKDDASGAQMRAMAATLVDEQAIADVAAYVQTLAHKGGHP